MKITLLPLPPPPRNKHFLKRWEQLVHWCSSVFRKLKFTGLILYVLRDGRGRVGMEIHITANIVKTSETRNCGACDWENVEYNCEGTAVVMLCLYLTAVLIRCFYPKVSERAKYFAAKWMGMLPRSLAPCGAHSHWGFVAVWMVPKSCTELFLVFSEPDGLTELQCCGLLNLPRKSHCSSSLLSHTAVTSVMDFLVWLWSECVILCVVELIITT